MSVFLYLLKSKTKTFLNVTNLIGTISDKTFDNSYQNIILTNSLLHLIFLIFLLLKFSLLQGKTPVLSLLFDCSGLYN